MFGDAKNSLLFRSFGIDCFLVALSDSWCGERTVDEC